MKYAEFKAIEMIETTGGVDLCLDFMGKVNEVLLEGDWQVLNSGVIETNVGLLRWAHLVKPK